jgi:hypothetical protein
MSTTALLVMDISWHALEAPPPTNLPPPPPQNYNHRAPTSENNLYHRLLPARTSRNRALKRNLQRRPKGQQPLRRRLLGKATSDDWMG